MSKQKPYKSFRCSHCKKDYQVSLGSFWKEENYLFCWCRFCGRKLKLKIQPPKLKREEVCKECGVKICRNTKTKLCRLCYMINYKRNKTKLTHLPTIK